MLTGLIGFSTLATGTTGLDVADAPGVSAALAVAIDAAAAPDGLALWQRVERRVSLRLLADLSAGLTLPADEALPLPRPLAGADYAVPPAGEAAGIIITWEVSPGPRRLQLLALSAAADAADADAAVVVIDLLDGTVLAGPTAAPLLTGGNVVTLATSVRPRYDGQQRTFVGLLTTAGLRGLTASALTAATVNPETGAETTASVARVSLAGGVNCDAEAWVARYADRFAAALWHLSAAELLNEKLNSPRVNWLTLHDPKAAAALRDALREAYEGLLAALLTNPPGGGPCAACGAAATTAGGLLP